MRLPDTVLNQRMDVMSLGPEQTTVWHLCTTEQHMKCGSGLGTLAVVTYEAPDIPDESPEKYFLMRLHPHENNVTDNVDGTALTYLPGAVSYRHSTVWSGKPGN